MTVYRKTGHRAYSYDFRFRGQRYAGSTGMSRIQDAREFERKERVRLERQSGDLALHADETPRIQDWVEVFFAHKAERRRLKRPDLLEREIRVVLEFCGATPTTTSTPANANKRRPPRRVAAIAAPRHNLRLGDFIERPELISDFERWMVARGAGPSARNHYRSILSGFYKVAMLPEYRRATGIRFNPFAGIERDRPPRRRVTQTVAQLRAWIEHAAPHVRLALAIGALAPALRLGTVLALRWDEHLDDALHFITIRDHKGDQATPEPIVMPVTGQLHDILLAAKTAWLTARLKRPKLTTAVIQFRGKAVASITKGLRDAAARAGVPYGLKTADGATFHTLRHTMSTLLAGLGVAEAHRKELLAHRDIATTQIYTHLRPIHLVGPLEQLSGAVPLADVMTAVGKPVGPDPQTNDRPQGTQPTAKRVTRVLKARKRQKLAGKIASGRRAS